MDGSFFALGLVGALLGYIIGDFQRELRYRRDSRSNLARAAAYHNHAGTNADAFPVPNIGAFTGTNNNGHGNGSTGAADSARREARRRAVRGDNGWTRSNPAPAGRYLRGTNETPVMAGRGWEFDGD